MYPELLARALELHGGGKRRSKRYTQPHGHMGLVDPFLKSASVGPSWPQEVFIAWKLVMWLLSVIAEGESLFLEFKMS